MTFFGDTLLEGGPYTNIVDYEPQYAGVCLPVDSFYFVLKHINLNCNISKYYFQDFENLQKKKIFV